MKFLLGLLFLLTFLVVATGLLSGLVKHKSARSTVRDVVAANGSRTRRRLALLAFLALSLGGCLIIADINAGSFRLAALIAVVGATALVFLPLESQGWIGTNGVRIGWLILPWERVETWRLGGEHLRFRFDERWHAIPVAEPDLERVRAVLTAAIADRENELV